MMLGDNISAEEAERMGMIYKVFDDESFAEESMKLAQKLSTMPTKALAYTKQLLNKSALNTLDKQLTEEDHFQSMAGKSYDYEEGVKAFLAKRKPEFKGK